MPNRECQANNQRRFLRLTSGEQGICGKFPLGVENYFTLFGNCLSPQDSSGCRPFFYNFWMLRTSISMLRKSLSTFPLITTVSSLTERPYHNLSSMSTVIVPEAPVNVYFSSLKNFSIFPVILPENYPEAFCVCNVMGSSPVLYNPAHKPLTRSRSTEPSNRSNTSFSYNASCEICI